MPEEKEKIVLDQRNRAEHVQLKSRRKIMLDNFIGGMFWGLGSVIGATLIVGILGLAIVRTRNVPLLGDIVKVVVTEIQTGIQEFATPR